MRFFSALVLLFLAVPGYASSLDSDIGDLPVALDAGSRVPNESRPNAGPSKVDVVFGGIAAPDNLSSMSSGLEAMLVERLEEVGRVRVVRMWDLGRILDNHAHRLLAGCLDDCGEMTHVLEALDVSLLLVGELHEVAGTHLLNLTLLDTATAKVLSRASVESRNERGLLRGLRLGAWSLVKDGDLKGPGLGSSGYFVPRMQLTVKGGNMAGVASTLSQRKLRLGRINVEAGYYFRNSALLFLEIGAGLGSLLEQGEEQGPSIDIVPIGLGLRRYWDVERVRLFVGGALGAGLLGQFTGRANDVGTALATTTALAGFDYRLSSRTVFVLEGSTSLGHVLERAEDRDFTVPVIAGVTAGISLLFR